MARSEAALWNGPPQSQAVSPEGAGLFYPPLSSVAGLRCIGVEEDSTVRCHFPEVSL
jgi:hypothetical protein